MESKKGKERAPKGNTDDSDRNSTGVRDDSSLLSRIASSASGLTNTVLAAPTGMELNETSHSALSGSGKPTSSSASGSQTVATLGENSKQIQPSIAGHALQEGIRAGHNAEHISKTEQEFSNFLDGIDSFVPSEAALVGGNGHENGVDEAFEYAWSRSRAAGDAAIGTYPHSSVQAQETRDGEAVLAILADRSSLDDQYELPPEEEDLTKDWKLSADQLAQLASFPRDLFPPFDLHGRISPENPLNLTVGQESQLLNGFATEQEETLSREHWRDQWDSVLSRYSDEVWGGLLPLAQKARKEVEEMQKNPSAIEQTPKALRRLAAILGHLQQR
ncbi:hypothetical protein GLAREA_05621 [Glarea lozoyensis ATCC 20868]|uniref:Uncharacterized protein n=1 Tax=Glarea lozoyensis (strain ATCC 20868 / MF5171) TaxID=1116229 RepID=S3EDC6_GLAL2|nr:uncharacterized protein GLAREA_05621 [Glarea lozoyensis ATCC 20868]EPE36283.1 hypothetical protein GLAREA_05621 [Glarea lozoyensis ATCC 20868]